MADDTTDSVANARELTQLVDGLQPRFRDLQIGANGFARAMSAAFTQSIIGGKQFDDVLKALLLRLSNQAVSGAFRSLFGGLSRDLVKLFAPVGGGGTGKVGIEGAMGAIKPFAAGGVIGTPTYFPLLGGGLGLAGEAGPEAILPLARGRDGRLGVAMNAGAAAPQVTIHIATPDADSFRRSESYLTGQIARAVARGQRSL